MCTLPAPGYQLQSQKITLLLDAVHLKPRLGMKKRNRSLVCMSQWSRRMSEMGGRYPSDICPGQKTNDSGFKPQSAHPHDLPEMSQTHVKTVSVFFGQQYSPVQEEATPKNSAEGAEVLENTDCVAEDVSVDWVAEHKKNVLGCAQKSQTAPSPASGCLARRNL